MHKNENETINGRVEVGLYIYKQMGSLVNVTCLWHGWLVGRQVGSLVNVTCQWHSWLVGWLVLSASQPHRVISVNNQ